MDITHQPIFISLSQVYYEKLLENGKAKMQVITTVMRKLAERRF
jgi:hypothetical protein